MRQHEPKGWFAIKTSDDEERVVHAISGCQPENARPITEEDAKRISGALRSVERQTALSAQGNVPIPTVDLSEVNAKIDALSKTVIEQAGELDKVQKKIDDHTSDISKVRENTAKAIAQMTEGIGEKGSA